jgi:hypothetical protein
VADSDPVKEYEETLNKAKGLLEAIHCLNLGTPVQLQVKLHAAQTLPISQEGVVET